MLYDTTAKYIIDLCIHISKYFHCIVYRYFLLGTFCIKLFFVTIVRMLRYKNCHNITYIRHPLVSNLSLYILSIVSKSLRFFVLLASMYYLPNSFAKSQKAYLYKRWLSSVTYFKINNILDEYYIDNMSSC